MLDHAVVFSKKEPSVWMLKVGRWVAPGPFVSRRETHMESMNACTVWRVLLRASSSMSCTPWRIKLEVVSSFQRACIVLRTRLGSMVQSPKMENMKVGFFMDGVVTRKVMLVEAQTVCWVRICMCTWFKL